MAPLVPDEDLSNLERNTPIREQVGVGFAGFPVMMMESRKRCRVAAPDGDYMELATLDGSTGYLEPRTKEIRTKMGQLRLSLRRVTARLSRGNPTNCGGRSTGSEYEHGSWFQKTA